MQRAGSRHSSRQLLSPRRLWLLLAVAGVLQLSSGAAACAFHHQQGGEQHHHLPASSESSNSNAHELIEAPMSIEYEDIGKDFLEIHSRRRLLAAASSSSTAAAGSAAGSAAAQPQQQHEQPGPRCGSRKVSRLERFQVSYQLSRAQAAQAALDDVPEGMMAIASAPYPLKGLSVNLYFHVISGVNANTTVAAPPELLAQQVEIMNAAYGPHNIRFVLRGVTRVTSDAWALTEINGPAETAMKTRVRRGGVSDLNIYIIRPASGTLGWSTFPWETSKLGLAFDGVVAHIGTLPGGSMHPYNKGYTIVHEVGHWLGLLHVFENGCGGSGDSVDDTPAQATAAYGCPLERDTCPQSGKDPVTNYMGYTDDSCMTGFTAGQAERILAMWEVYRGTSDNSQGSTVQESASVQLPSGTTYGMSLPIKNDNIKLQADPAALAAAAQQGHQPAQTPRASAGMPAVLQAPLVRSSGSSSSASSSSSSSSGPAIKHTTTTVSPQKTGSSSSSSSSHWAPRPPAYIQSRPATGTDVLDMQATLLAAMGAPTQARVSVAATSHRAAREATKRRPHATRAAATSIPATLPAVEGMPPSLQMPRFAEG